MSKLHHYCSFYGKCLDIVNYKYRTVVMLEESGQWLGVTTAVILQ